MTKKQLKGKGTRKTIGRSLQALAGIGGASVAGSSKDFDRTKGDVGKGFLGALVLAGIGEALVQAEKRDKRKAKKKKKKHKKG